MHREELIKYLEKMVDGKRLRHILGVEQSACELAGIYGVDASKASTAALLHDIYRSYPPDAALEKAEEYGIVLDSYTKEYPVVLHGELAACFAKEHGITDADIIGAVRKHIFGAPRMSWLEQIIYVSDLIEPNREYDGVEELRQLAKKDLDACVLQGLKNSCMYLERRGLSPRPVTREALDYYEGVVGN